ncbi:PREDICTED: transcription factor LHW-like [Camelina sativa]|uniref:Transcription factor LHW-like n=1 Tax=Camelina sativa TaxID=90675 RepID=A0ABM0W493_CAMSA|nr:PREDICTED: transcription factor LHW-like [Camelina sativa]
MVGSEHHHHHQHHHQNHQQQQQRSKEALGMVALHEALRTVCLNTDWTYSVFWSIRPRPRVRGGGNGCKVGDDNGSLMLMWEDGYCRGRGGTEGCYGDMEGEDPVRKSFSKMSIQLYNYGEGLMGKVASDKCHKWVFKEQTESESNASSYWQSSFDAIPSEWNDQFESGIQTIAVIQAGHGLLQLGSCKIIPEDLHFVLRMRHTFESLGYQSGFYLSQLFSANRTTSSSNTSLMGSNHPILPPQTQPLQPSLPHYSWSGTSQRPMMAQTSLPNYQPHMPFPVMPHSNKEQDPDVKWPTGLSFFNALTNNVNAKLLFDSEGLGDKTDHQSHQNQSQEQSNSESQANPSEFLSLDSHHRNMSFLE